MISVSRSCRSAPNSCVRSLTSSCSARALVRSQPEQILILAKAIGLSWDTKKEILGFYPGAARESGERLEQCFASFLRLSPNTAKAALRFYRLRERASQGSVH